MPTHTFTRSYNMGSSPSLSGANAMSFEGEVHAGPVTVAFASPDKQVDIGFPYATLKALFILTAKSYCWTYLDGGPDTAMPNPLSANVTKMFFTKATSGSCTVEVIALYDATP